MWFFLFIYSACKPPIVIVQPKIDIRYRTVDGVYYTDYEHSEEEMWVQNYFSKGFVDLGLKKAAEELLGSLRKPTLFLTQSAVQLATTRNGYPGQARFAKVLNTGNYPDELIDMIDKDVQGRPFHYTIVRRTYGTGMNLWLVGWAPQIISVDPVKRDIPLDGSIGLRVSGNSNQSTLLLTNPEQDVEVMPLLPEAYRIIRKFSIPGAYRFEVITENHKQNIQEVALLFSVYVDEKPPPPERLLTRDAEVENPLDAENWMLEELNALRIQKGLVPLRKFKLFVPLARSHSAWMAAEGVIAHRISGVTKGVDYHAEMLAHPRARHFENVAAAYTAKEAWHLAINSPGHLQVFLCKTCTHVSIGASVEPVINSKPRLFFTWEVLEFPQGEPKRIEYMR
jgi:uncharacterized protein YkwD